MEGEGTETGTVATEVPAMTGASGGEPQGSAPGSGGQPAAEKTSFTKEEVSHIVQERLKAWQKYGKPEELDHRLTRAQQLEQFYQNMQSQMRPGQVPGQAQAVAAPETEEDKKVRAYMDRMYPGLSKWQEQQQAVQQSLQAMNTMRWESVATKGRESLKDWATKAGYKPEQVQDLENRVTDSIRGNPQDHQAFVQTGNVEIVKKHFDAIDKWVKSFGGPAAGAAPANAQYAADKAKTKALPPRMPPGGVTAPTSQTKKLTDSERVSAAFEAYRKG